jgi:phospholipid/cholesterol/gamma-HCH transport system ATP-binding protein
MESAIVSFRNVHKTFGTNRVLQGLTLDIPRNRISFVIGRSGEGKSVTLKHIVGILRPDIGQVLIDNEDMSNATEEQWIHCRKKMGLLFQDGALFDSLSVAENISFAMNEETRVVELLELVGLPGQAQKYPPQLSIGEKKRVGLARALALSPQLLMYDEPTTGMDPMISELIDELISRMQKTISGLTSVVISHDLRSIMSVAEHIIFLHEGRVLLQGPPSVFESSTDPILIQFLSGSSSGPLSRPIA